MSGPALALLGVSLLWGTTFVAVKSGLRDASPLLFVGLRFAIATAGSTALLRQGERFRRGLRPGIPLGIVLALGYATQTAGLASTTPSRSAFVTGTNVALVPLLGWAIVRARPGKLPLAGLVLVLPGLWLLTDPGAGAWNRGDGWTLACAFFFALHVVLLHRLAPGRPLVPLLVVQLGVTALACLAAAPFLEEPRLRPTSRLAGALALTALLATTGTTWLQLRFQPRVEPARAALLYATEPVFAALFSRLFFQEVLEAAAWAGGGLILAGMVLSGRGAALGPDPAGTPLPRGISSASPPGPPPGAGGPSRSPRA